LTRRRRARAGHPNSPARRRSLDRPGVERAVNLEDILIIAPYNAQAFDLKDKMPGVTIVVLPQEVATDGVRKASRSHAFDSPVPGEHMDVERPGQTENITVPRTGSAYCDLFHDRLDARGRAARHEFPLLAQSAECGDFACAGVEYFGVFAGAV